MDYDALFIVLAREFNLGCAPQEDNAAIQVGTVLAEQYRLSVVIFNAVKRTTINVGVRAVNAKHLARRGVAHAMRGDETLQPPTMYLHLGWAPLALGAKVTQQTKLVDPKQRRR